MTPGEYIDLAIEKLRLDKLALPIFLKMEIDGEGASFYWQIGSFQHKTKISLSEVSAVDAIQPLIESFKRTHDPR